MYAEEGFSILLDSDSGVVSMCSIIAAFVQCASKLLFEGPSVLVKWLHSCEAAL